MAKKILLTGAKGFIGKRLLEALKDGYTVSAVDADYDGRYDKTEFDGIIHLGGVSRVRDGLADPVACLQSNIVGTAKYLSIPHKWFIFASTCEKDNNVYGFSKACAEKYVKMTAKRYVIMRLTNVYGPGMLEDKLLARIKSGAVKEIPADALPFEYIRVEDLVVQIKLFIRSLESPESRSFSMKLCNGVAKTPEELADVAASY